MVAALVAMVSGTASAQPAPLEWTEQRLDLDTGPVQAVADAGPGGQIVFSKIIGSAQANWVRLEFGEVQFAGALGDGTNARLRLTSLKDGAHQMLDAVSIEQWSHTSAYFNGSWVLAELIAHPETGPSRVMIETLQVGADQASGHQGICDGQDDREPTVGPPDARTFPTGCTAFLIGERCFLSAGHCSISGQSVAHFNLPLSDSDGSLNFAHPDDQYPLDGESIQGQNDAPVCDNDWAYYGVFNNSNTGLSPYEAQGEHYTLADAAPEPAGQTVRIRGYGQTIHGDELPLEWNQVLKIATGPYVDLDGTLMFFQADVSGGDSGSALFDVESQTVIGIVNCNGCASSSVQANRGMAINQSNLQNALANPQGICAGACPGEGTCFEANGTSGCDDTDCCITVCAEDPFCCETEWDTLCADAAMSVCAIPGDLNGDGIVNGADLGILLSEWGPCDDCSDCPADLTGDCAVAGADLGVLLSNWSE